MNRIATRSVLRMGLGITLAIAPTAASAQLTPVSEPGNTAQVGAPDELSDPFLVHLRNARALFGREQYQAALAEYQSAYALRQSPLLLFELAKVQQRLGNHAEAEALYRRYLTATDDPRDPNRAEAERVLDRLRSLFPQSTPTLHPAFSPTAELPYRVVTRPHHRGMVAAGWTLLSLGYAAAFGTGIGMGIGWSATSSCVSYSYYCSRSPSAAAGWTLLIPVAGPLVSGILAPATATDSTTYSLVWTLPWLLADWPLQIIGVVLLWKGYRTPQKIMTPNFLTSVQVKPYSTPTGGGLVMTGTF